MNPKEIIINQPDGKTIKVFVGWRDSRLEVWTESLSGTKTSLVFSTADMAYISDLLWSFKHKARQS